jgi:hypothetical protein
MTDLSNAVCTDFTGKEWNRLSRGERKTILANTDPDVRKAWINEQTSFKFSFGRLFLILGILFFTVIGSGIGWIQYQRYYNAFATDSVCIGHVASPQFQAQREAQEAAHQAAIQQAEAVRNPPVWTGSGTTVAPQPTQGTPSY